MIRKFLLILLSAALLYSCIDEPTIEPTPLPYTSVRLGNFSANVDAINVTIDGEQSFDIENGNLTNYFDLISGKRGFLVTNTTSSEVIFEADLEVTSYEELNVLFSGYSAPGDDINNSFGNTNYTEGVVYLLEEPEEGRVRVRFFNMISDSPDTTSIDIILDVYDVAGDSSQTTSSEIAFNEVIGLEIEEGQKIINVLNADETDTLYTYDAGNIELGYDYFVFITGLLDEYEVVMNRRTPLEVREK
jgi:hypothetical protein